jgi:hypothetical protein
MIILIVILIFILINEAIQSIYRQFQRRYIYKLAINRAKQTNKKLTVIGDPYYGKGTQFWNSIIKGYDCGDITVDLTGAPKCPNGIKSDILKFLKTQKDNSQIIFISCVLEYVDNIEDVVKELYRVSGGPQNLFIVTVKNYSYAAYFYKEDNYSSKYIIKAPPEYKSITWTPI